MLFANTSLELKKMLKEQAWGWTFDKQIKNVNNDQQQKHKLVLHEEVMHYIDEYIYLNQLIFFKNRQDKEIKRRIHNAWKSYWSMKAFLIGNAA